MIDDSEDNLSLMLQSLARKAGLEPHGRRIRFHCLRKYLIDHLSATANESQWKQIVGKQIAESAYVSQDQLRGIYSRAMPSLLINGNGAKTRKLIELEQAMGQLESENMALKTRIRLLQRIIEKSIPNDSIENAINEIRKEHRIGESDFSVSPELG